MSTTEKFSPLQAATPKHTSKRSAFFVSDRTGITAEMLGHSLLRQFEGTAFAETTLPYIDSPEKAREAVGRINRAFEQDGIRPLVLSTLIDPDISAIIATANALLLDCFNIFIAPLEAELGVKSSHTIGHSHRLNDHGDQIEHRQRIEAVGFTMRHDDGLEADDLGQAEVILIGVSRSGKTPTCLYLALQYGIRAANYPLVPEDFNTSNLPDALKHARGKLFGLTLQAQRLHQIRGERKPGSEYASLKNCQYEVNEAESLMRQQGIPYLDATHKSIEELATTILQKMGLKRSVF